MKKSIVAAVVIALAGVIVGCGADTKSGEAKK
ncbi:amino acid ABC transporter substrate-binding protein, partial [Clostridium perfringens]